MRARTGWSEYRPDCYDGQKGSNRKCKDERSVCNKWGDLLANERTMTLLNSLNHKSEEGHSFRYMKQESAERESLPPKPPAHLPTFEADRQQPSHLLPSGTFQAISHL